MGDVTRTAVNQPPGGGTDYPFTGVSALAGGVLDFYLTYERPACPYTMPLSLEVTGTQFTVTDGIGTVVADAGTGDALSRAWGDRTVFDWYNASAGWTMRAVVGVLADGSGELDARTWEQTPRRVRSLKIGDVSLTGDVVILAGNNIAVSGTVDENVDGSRYSNTVDIDAVAGAGLGRVNGCDEVDVALRTINGQSADCGGNFFVDTDPCFRSQLPLVVSDPFGVPEAAYAADGLTTEEAASSLRVTSDCHPCRDCSYYVRVYKGLKRVWDQWKAVAVSAEAVRDLYAANRTRWETSRDCRLANPARLVTSGDGNCKISVGGSVCNFTTCCTGRVELRFTFRKYVAGVPVAWPLASGVPADIVVTEAYIKGSGTADFVPYSPRVVGQIVRFFNDYAEPQETTVAKFKVCMTCAADESLMVVLTAHVPDAGTDPYTGVVCEQPDASDEIPTWVQEAWNDNHVDGSNTGDTDTVRAVLTKVAPFKPDAPSFDCGCLDA